MTRIKNKVKQFSSRTAVLSAMAISAFGLALIPLASAATTTDTVVTPDTAVYDSKNVVGVQGDYAPGFQTGSIASDGSGKTDTYFTSQSLFGRDVQLGEIASMSYWTKKSTDHVTNPADWYVTIYTNPYESDVSSASWYGDRIGTEPYFSQDLNETAGAWNKWSTDEGNNQLRFFESTAGASGATFGSYADPTWAEFVMGNSLSGTAYAGHTVQSFSVQTGSAWADGFQGQVDGLTITLTDGSKATVNFEAQEAPVAVNDKNACKNGGWESQVDANGKGFKNQGLCVSYVASNGKSAH
jgi:hypothetical protein